MPGEGNLTEAQRHGAYAATELMPLGINHRIDRMHGSSCPGLGCLRVLRFLRSRGRWHRWRTAGPGRAGTRAPRGPCECCACAGWWGVRVAVTPYPCEDGSLCFDEVMAGAGGQKGWLLQLRCPLNRPIDFNPKTAYSRNQMLYSIEILFP